jgi:hypothetical protein
MSEPHASKDDSMAAAVRSELRRIASTIRSGSPPPSGAPPTTLPGRVWGKLVNSMASVRGRIERALEAGQPDERTVWHLAPRPRSMSRHAAHRR